MLSEHELHLMRHAIADSLPDLCTVKSRTTVVDGQGGVTETWASTINVPCKLAPAGYVDRTASLGERYTVTDSWILTVRYDTTIAAGYRVVLGGDTYEVLGVQDDRSERLCRRASLRRVE